jgi:hypothetical protein
MTHLVDATNEFVRKVRPAKYAGFVTWGICLSQMQPGLHMLFSLPLLSGAIFALWALARWEGSHLKPPV